MRMAISVTGRTRCYDGFKRFKDGRISVGVGLRSGCPSTSTDDAHVRKLMKRAF